MAQEIVIVGAGPAGMVLAYQLVTNGIPVRVLERHTDFDREFRGELINPAVLGPLEKLGVLQLATQRGDARPNVVRRLFVGKTREVMVPGGKELGSLISQPGFLQLLHELCGKYPHYRMDLGTTALEMIREGDRVVGLKTRKDGVEGRVDGSTFIICNGRNSALRKSAGLESVAFTVGADVLWLRMDFSDAQEVLPSGVDVHMFGRGVVIVFFRTTKNRLQIAYSAPGDLSALKKDLPELRRRLLPNVPDALRPHVERKLDDNTETQILRVIVDRLTKWHTPGLLFLGDAAHTMSPSGGIGLNIAIRDAISAANHIISAVKANQPIDTAVFEKIQAERLPEVEQIQAMQTRIHRAVMAPLFVEHLMFTMLGVVARRMEKKGVTRALPPVEPQYAVRAS